MTEFLAICMGYFLMLACFDIADLVKRVNRADWIFLLFNTGMFVFAAQALWERF